MTKTTPPETLCAACDQTVPLDAAGNLAEHMRPVGGGIVENTCPLSGWEPIDPALPDDQRMALILRATKLGPRHPARQRGLIEAGPYLWPLLRTAGGVGSYGDPARIFRPAENIYPGSEPDIIGVDWYDHGPEVQRDDRPEWS